MGRHGHFWSGRSIVQLLITHQASAPRTPDCSRNPRDRVRTGRTATEVGPLTVAGRFKWVQNPAKARPQLPSDPKVDGTLVAPTLVMKRSSVAIAHVASLSSCLAFVAACSIQGPTDDFGPHPHGSSGTHNVDATSSGGSGPTSSTGLTMSSQGGSDSQAGHGGHGGWAAQPSGTLASGSGGAGGAPPGLGGSSGSTQPATPTGCTPNGLALVNEMNAYRIGKGLAPVPASSSLCVVSELHVADLATNKPHTAPGCNLHSWSDQGNWSPCCYTSDHKQASCMWKKPAELTSYSSYGYEISAAGVGSAQSAVNLWKSSKGHDAVMVNEGVWANMPWKAAGAAIANGYAVIWFGSAADPAP